MSDIDTSELRALLERANNLDWSADRALDVTVRFHLPALLDAADERDAAIQQARADAWDEGHAAGRDYQGDGWNSDAHDPADDNPYREVTP